MKLIIFSVLILFSILTLISFVVPSHIRVSKTINIKAGTEDIFRYIDDLDKWRKWHPAFKNLPSEKIKFIDSSNGKLSKLKIDQTLITLLLIRRDTVEAEFLIPGKKPVICDWFISAKPEPGVLTLCASMDFTLKWYPWEKFSSLFFDKTYGAQLEQGLVNLKTLAEE
jgi:polyketide cyclase/dehydrase/lipid transport protein